MAAAVAAANDVLIATKCDELADSTAAAVASLCGRDDKLAEADRISFDGPDLRWLSDDLLVVTIDCIRCLLHRHLLKVLKVGIQFHNRAQKTR